MIAAQLVFRVSSGFGGLGWFTFETRNCRETDQVFAGLSSALMIGLLVEGLVF